MKILTFEEFVKEPIGTIFAYLDNTGELYKLGDVILHGELVCDFFQLELFPIMDFEQGKYIIESAYCRWGMFDYETMFLVLETDDLEQLKNSLNK